MWALGARRALTFLEQQPEVNAEKLGVYGHFMGGKLTVMTAAADDRVKAEMNHTTNRFWHSAKATRAGNSRSAELPLMTIDKPLWVYANVLYALDQPVTGAGYYYGKYTTRTFNLSSRMAIVSPAELEAAAVRATRRDGVLS